ncbi:MAG: PIN domain-containing protein [Magnetococcales bacterium]|nr:PIN domain-containing protein [Magnetococcales bacterium]
MSAADPTAYLLDTNVVSEATKRSSDRAVIDFLRMLSSTHLSVITLAEIQSGISRNPNQSGRLSRWLSNARKSCTSHAVTEEIAILAGQWHGELKSVGRSQEFQDVMIGATAHSLGMTLLTRNKKDFDEMRDKGLRVQDPWES